MNRNERVEIPQEAIHAALDGKQADMWTAIPGIIQKFYPANRTCDVQPAIQANVTNITNGSKSWVNMPILLDCPIVFPTGGGCSLTFPLAVGDECLVVFSSRCIDSWWQNSGVQNQHQVRMHDLSDGFVLPGPCSVPKVQPNISITQVELRSQDHSTIISLNPTTQAVNITAPGGVTITGSLTVTGDVIGQGTSLHTHKHGGVQTGGGQTGVPV